MKMQQNLWNTLKAALCETFLTASDCIKKSGRVQLNDLMMWLKNMEKQEQTKSKHSWWQELIKLRA